MAVMTEALPQVLAEQARWLSGSDADFDPLLELVGDARLVLIGEASHGTHEFYRLRAQLTRRLILEKGFCAVAAEADWPDAYRVNRHVRGLGKDRDAEQALSGFQRFPAWMWRNTDVLDFVGWLREHNDRLAQPERKVGFYGLDLYSLRASMEAVIGYLEKVDPAAAQRARYRYACFEQFGEDPQQYGYAASFGLAPDCEADVVAQLVELQRQSLLAPDGISAEEERFQAVQNARVVQKAEAYYRAMFGGRVASWNLRDTHMADTLDELLGHLDGRSGKARIVVWAHNSHVGDSRATEMGRAGEVNIGMLARERHPNDTCLIGLSTFTGTVTAASDWGAPAQRMKVRPALPDSYEWLFHRAGPEKFVLVLRGMENAALAFREGRLQRAIGVVYRPQTERLSHYFITYLPGQLDAIIHLDETHAVEPLERTAGWDRHEVPETYPAGL